MTPANSYYLGAYCRKCGHHARLNIAKLKAYLGLGFRLAEIRERLRCQRCGDRKQIVLRLLDPSQRTGNLVYLFERKAEG